MGTMLVGIFRDFVKKKKFWKEGREIGKKNKKCVLGICEG